VRFIQRRLAACVLSGVLAWLTLPSPSHAQNVGDVAKGGVYAAKMCAQCHGVLANEVVSPRFNIASFKRIANTPGMTEQALSIWLTTSHPTMPNLIIELEDRRNVVAYIVSLREPPPAR
jgi:mono/diheme cytochrome c family protein